jgi:hypothetical protein
MARPSGFSWAMPAARLAVCLTSAPLGVASRIREAVPPAVSPPRDAVPATASLALVVASLSLDRTASALSATFSLAREGTSAL